MNCDKSWLNDAYRVSGKHFPVPDENTAKGVDEGPNGTVAQSERQRDPSLNASGGIQNSPSIRGEEGQQFPTASNSKSSTGEQATFAGDRDASVSVNLVSGQIQSDSTYRVVPNNRQIDGKVQVRGRKAKADVKEDKFGQ